MNWKLLWHTAQFAWRNRHQLEELAEIARQRAKDRERVDRIRERYRARLREHPDTSYR